jgi:hypothetical protein
MKSFTYSLLIVFISTASAFASVSISSPSSGEHVISPFTLSATSTSCSSQTVGTMGYSIDSGDTTTISNTSFDEQVSAAVGTHTVHVKSWGDQGAACVTDVAIDVTSVTDNATADISVVPSNAVSVSSLQKMGGWQEAHDSGTSGHSSGKMSLVGSPVHSGSSREFVTKFSSAAGERYAISFADNTTSTNFFYDGWIYFTSSASHIANLELDLNQTMPNGQTVFMGIQCDGYTGTWDYTENLGSATHPKGHWAHSSSACNPRSWTRDKWHHVQASFSRTSTGRITYKTIYLDGVKHTLNHTVFAARAVGWGNSLMTQFQIDSLSSSTITAYLDDLTIYRW